MIQDQLTRLERVRLEALEQAKVFPITAENAEEAQEQYLRLAERIEKWLLAAEHGGH